MGSYLSIRSGPEAGRKYRLDPERPMHIGRGSGCEVQLSDPISSRFHAVLYFEEGHWQIRDNKSRNGTTVNGQKTDHAMLLDQTVVRVGGTELQFTDLNEEPFGDRETKQTIIADRKMLESGGYEVLPSDPLREAAHAGNLLDLYQLSIQLLRSGDPGEVIATSASLVRDRTGAEAIGFFRLGQDGQLTSEYIFPSNATRLVSPSAQLVRRVVSKGEALWFNSDDPSLSVSKKPKKDTHASDAILIPLIDGDKTVGVMAAFRTSGSFERTAFEFAIAAGRLCGAALVAIRQKHSLQTERKRLAERNAEGDELIGKSPGMLRLKERVQRIGKANGCVLIRGESGAGKELVAQAVHRASPRYDRPLLSVNCAAIPRDLVESQLFGHRKGAFTGADSDHAGWFQQAHTGTLFLDEVGELTLEAQAKLLRILEGHPFLPVGATEEIKVDVRVVAATNRDLAEFVRAKQFREDLYYRLSVFELLVPPLRDRGEDIELLINHFIEHFGLRHGRPQISLSKAARQRLLEYHWPGNVRQLRNVIDSATVMSESDEIQSDELGLRDAGTGNLDTLKLDHWEEKLIREALSRCDGSVPEAAKLLGISRATAYRKVSDYGIER